MSYAKQTTTTIIPALRYKDAHKAIAWLEQAFGFSRHAVYEGPDNTVAHAQLTLGNGMIMLGSESNGGEMNGHLVQPADTGGRSTVSICLVVSDAAAVYATAKAAGAEIVMDLKEMDYGGRAFSCKDLEGNLWSVGEYDPWA